MNEKILIGNQHRGLSLTNRACIDSNPRCFSVMSTLIASQASRLPCSHECEHYQRGADRAIVLISCFTRSPLRQAEHFHEENRKEKKQYEPE